jgi:hypothetical protein
VWEWNRETTAANAFEYVWAVSWTNGSVTPQVGYFVVKAAGASPSSGSLSQLLAVGLCVGSNLSPTGGSPPSRPTCVAEDDRVVLVLDDAGAVQTLFSERPSSARVQMKLAGQAAVSATVDVRYE